MIATFDLGGTKLAVAIADNAGKLHHTARIPTQDRDPRDVFSDAADFFKPHKFTAIGVASFGPLVGTALSKSTPKIPWRGADLPTLLRGADLLKKNTPFVLLQDVQAEVIGEASLGNHGKHSRYAYATISTGIGVGIFDKEQNRLNPAAEAGHLAVPALNKTRGICKSHKLCWEGFCSGTALKLKPDGKPHRMPSAWVVRTAHALYSLALTNALDIIILGGGVIDSWQHHKSETLARLTKHMQQFNNNYIPLPKLATASIPNRALAGIAIAASKWAHLLP
jgi:predicted NBD/HSP70 family sugar kinase